MDKSGGRERSSNGRPFQTEGPTIETSGPLVIDLNQWIELSRITIYIIITINITYCLAVIA